MEPIIVAEARALETMSPGLEPVVFDLIHSKIKPQLLGLTPCTTETEFDQRPMKGVFFGGLMCT